MLFLARHVLARDDDMASEPESARRHAEPALLTHHTALILDLDILTVAAERFVDGPIEIVRRVADVGRVAADRPIVQPHGGCCAAVTGLTRERFPGPIQQHDDAVRVQDRDVRRKRVERFEGQQLLGFSHDATAVGGSQNAPSEGPIRCAPIRHTVSTTCWERGFL